MSEPSWEQPNGFGEQLPHLFFKVTEVQRVDSICYLTDVLGGNEGYF